MKKNKKIYKRNKNICGVSKGFTLLETLVAIFVFSLMMTMISGVFSGFIRNYFSQQKSLTSIENAQYALNLMEKTIRTSVVYTEGASTLNNINSTGATVPVLDFSGNDSNRLMMYDNSQSKCIVYHFNNVLNIIEMASSDSDSINGCGNFDSINNYSALTSNDIDNVWVNGWSSAQGVAGRISVAIAVKEPGQTTPALNVGMTASLRDFEPEPVVN